MKDLNKVVAMNIRALRKHRKLTQTEMADRAGITRGYLGDLELNRKASMSLNTLQRLSKKLDVTVYQLLDEEGVNNDFKKK